MTRVAVVADSALLRAGLEALLGAEPSVVLVGALGGVPNDGRDDGVSLRALVAALEPDVVVWVPGAESPRRPHDDAADADLPDPGVVVLVDRADAEAVRRALRSGARALLPTDAEGDAVVAAVQAVAAGLVALPRELADEVLAARRAGAGADAPPALLTPREREVLALLAEGMANKAIAPRLGISEHTVKAHVAAIYEKLHAGNRAEAVMAAARQGLVLL